MIHSCQDIPPLREISVIATSLYSVLYEDESEEGQPYETSLMTSASQITWHTGNAEIITRQESPMGILTGHSDPPHPQVSQMLARSSIYTNRRDEKCDCVTQYFDYNVTG